MFSVHVVFTTFVRLILAQVHSHEPECDSVAPHSFALQFSYSVSLFHIYIFRRTQATLVTLLDSIRLTRGRPLRSVLSRGVDRAAEPLGPRWSSCIVQVR